MLYPLTCASCARHFTAASPLARTCSDACRAAIHRARLAAQRAALAAEADAAAARGDLAELTAFARRTASLLA